MCVCAYILVACVSYNIYTCTVEALLSIFLGVSHLCVIVYCVLERDVKLTPFVLYGFPVFVCVCRNMEVHIYPQFKSSFMHFSV